jgi:hypothetical protein
MSLLFNIKYLKESKSTKGENATRQFDEIVLRKEIDYLACSALREVVRDVDEKLFFVENNLLCSSLCRIRQHIDWLEREKVRKPSQFLQEQEETRQILWGLLGLTHYLLDEQGEYPEDENVRFEFWIE